ncbi:MAG: hypothetical protein Q8R24_00005 [Legionellaceae bacterium]|nr:hypothetical protein [Legionellaceae bacterium]
MPIPRLSLNIANLMELKAIELMLKKSRDNTFQQKAILQKSFDNKMLNLSLTPRPSKPKRLNDELASNYQHLRIAKAVQIKNQYNQPSRAPTPRPNPTMQPSNCAAQQAFKAQLNQLIARDSAVQKELTKKKLAKKAIEEKMAHMSHVSRMGM